MKKSTMTETRPTLTIQTLMVTEFVTVQQHLMLAFVHLVLTLSLLTRLKQSIPMVMESAIMPILMMMVMDGLMKMKLSVELTP